MVDLPDPETPMTITMEGNGWTALPGADALLSDIVHLVPPVLTSHHGRSGCGAVEKPVSRPIGRIRPAGIAQSPALALAAGSRFPAPVTRKTASRLL